MSCHLTDASKQPLPLETTWEIPMYQEEKPQPLVLAVDDNSDNLWLLSLALEFSGFSCICLSCGEEVVAAAKQVRPQLILLDIVMAGISGLEVASCLKAEPETSDIPIVGMTAMVTHVYPQSWLPHFFDEWLTKPYLLDDLEDLVSRYLQRSAVYQTTKGEPAKIT